MGFISLHSDEKMGAHDTAARPDVHPALFPLPAVFGRH
jgi:hypothetical protein